MSFCLDGPIAGSSSMPIEPTHPHGGIPPEPDAALHERLGEEIAALQARLGALDAARRHETVDVSSSGAPDSADADVREIPGIPE